MVSSLSLFTHKVIRCRSSLIKLVVSPTISKRIFPSSSSWLGAHIGDRLSSTPRRSLQSYVSQNCQQQKRNQKHQKQQQLSGVNRIENTHYYYCHQRQRYFSTPTSSESSSSCTIDEESENDNNSNINDDKDVNFVSRSLASSTLESDVVEDENKRRKVADVSFIFL